MKHIGSFIIIISLVACNSNTTSNDSNSIVASTGKHKLYSSNLKDIYPSNSSQKDSIQIRNAYVDQWVRDHILLEEAEKYVMNELDIEKLIKDYRSSLIIHNYEKTIVSERLDTSISDEQKLITYEANKSSYLLNAPVVNAKYAIIPINNPELKDFRKAWIKQDGEKIKEICTKYNLPYSFEEENWITFADFKALLPLSLFPDDRLKSNKSLNKEVNKVQYFVKVIEFRDNKEEAPLTYIEDKIEKVILYNRKINLLKDIKSKLYERDLELKKIKIYNH